MPSNYEFTVRRELDWGDYSEPPTKVDRWIVSLPHQCDSWEITGRYGSGEDHAEAVAALQAFIEQARAALLALIHRWEMEDGVIEIKIEGSA